MCYKYMMVFYIEIVLSRSSSFAIFQDLWVFVSNQKKFAIESCAQRLRAFNIITMLIKCIVHSGQLGSEK